MPLSRLGRPTFLALLLYMCAIGVWRAAAPPPGPPPECPDEGRLYQGRARVESPVRQGTRASVVVGLEGRARAPRALAFLPDAASAERLRVGEEIELRGVLRAPRRKRNPGEFDERRWLEDRGVACILRVDRLDAAVGSKRRWRDLPQAWAEEVRRSIREMLVRTYGPVSGPLIAAIALGSTEGLSPALVEAIKDAGAFHLIVPSGTNVAFVLGFCLWLAAAAGLRGGLRLAPPLAAAAFYGLIVGADPPYLRALLCAAVAVTAKLLDRQYDLFQALTLSAGALLLYWPRMLFHMGFQMSYLVLFSFLLAEPDRLAPAAWPRWARLGAGLVATNLVAQLSLLPLLASIGGTFSAGGILANVLLVPLSGLLLGAAFALWLLSFLPVPSLFSAAAAAAGLVIRGFEGTCFACAALPGSAVRLAPMGAAAAAAHYEMFLAACLWRRRAEGAWVPRAARALAVSGLLLALVSCAAARAGRRELRVLSLRYDGGGASLVRFPDGTRWLVYASGPPAAVARALRARGVRRLERIVFLLPRRGSPDDSWAALASLQLAEDSSVWAGPEPLVIADGRVRMRFDAEGPRLFVDTAESVPFAMALADGAVEAAIDGESARVRPAR
ncbi:MAG: ComEC/Rec2 family competence protein [Elusimicrobia bacterium]|nr:ComEC/Rec2 family competence protein [Elusimicrobiota bacterium]